MESQELDKYKDISKAIKGLFLEEYFKGVSVGLRKDKYEEFVDLLEDVGGFIIKKIDAKGLVINGLDEFPDEFIYGGIRYYILKKGLIKVDKN